MKENVGTMDQTLRGIFGPLLVLTSYSRLKAGKGGLLSGLGMILGTALTETAITRVCPLNKLMRVDSRSPLEAARDREQCLMQSPQPIPERKEGTLSADRSAPVGLVEERDSDLSLPS